MRTRDEQLAEVLADLAAEAVSNGGVDGVLRRLSDHCSDLFRADAVGVLLADEASRPRLVGAASGALGGAIERLEVELEEGPCSDAALQGEQVAVPDLARAVDRYPRFVPRALDLGARAIHAFPMSAGGAVVGVMDVIAMQPTKLSEQEARDAQLLAEVAVAHLTTGRLARQSSAAARQLQHALTSRVVIEQAKGVLAERHGESVEQAFDRLRRHARASGTRLHAVARAVLAGRLSV